MITKLEDGKTWRLVANSNITADCVNELQKSLLTLVSEAHEEKSEIHMDLSKVEFVDSMGIKLLLGLYKSCKTEEVPLTMEVASAQVMKVMRLCKLDQLINIQEVSVNG
ncbi:MAG: STAS domain-containing protein [Candidatus Melainabacteria bacterium]